MSTLPPETSPSAKRPKRRRKRPDEGDTADTGSVPLKERQIVAMRSGGICAFPGCGAELVAANSEADNPVITGEVAHIIAKHRQGPRGNVELSAEARNKASNLVYLCPPHHKLVDTELRIYTVQVLRRIKEDHEVAMAKRGRQPAPTQIAHAREHLQSTVLPVRHMPAVVFSAPCTVPKEENVAQKINYAAVTPDVLVPFLIREHHLYAFCDLADASGPLAGVVDRKATETFSLAEFTSSADGRRRCVILLNIALRRLLRDKNIGFDKEHNRIYFRPAAPGQERVVSYTAKSGRTDSRSVVYQPMVRATGELKKFWWHMAARLSFQLVGENQWALSIRPERHLTKDGTESLPSDRIGRKVTRLKATMYNEQYLNEIVFWREFLAGGSPDIILNFGDQSCIIGAELLQFDISWPGVVHDPVKAVQHPKQRDLFAYARFRAAGGLHEDEEFPDE
jgi:hypothetical protein